MADEPSETMPEDVRQAFIDAVHLFKSWQFDTPAPTLRFRTIAISLSGVCDLVLAYKNERLPVGVHDAIGARCLDTLIQDRRSAVGVARSFGDSLTIST
jgi:hypothetical protein